MPGAPYGLSNDEPVSQRTVIVRAVRADREQPIALSHQDRILRVDPAEHRAAVGKAAQCEAVSEIRPRRCLRVCHEFPPVRAVRLSIRDATRTKVTPDSPPRLARWH